MSKVINTLVVVSALFFVGCAEKNATVPNSQSVVGQSVQVNQPVSSDTTGVYKKLQALDLRGARNLGDSYYANGDFVNALVAYDFTCVKFQDIPTCVKMAGMFEKGEGVSLNKEAALDIYQRACFGGFDPSCKDMRRLQR